MAGWKQWTRERLTSSQLQQYLQDQVVARFTSAAQRSAQIVAPTLNMVSVRDDAPGRLEVWDGDSWESIDVAASGRQPITVTSQVASGSALHPQVIIPAVAVPTRVTLLASGRTGFATTARAVRWWFDSVPASATNFAQDDDGSTPVTAPPSGWTAATAGATFDLPANTAGTFRLMMSSDGTAYNRGGTLWWRTRI